MTKTADAATVNAGDPIGFTITVANGGPGLAKDVVLSDPLPAGLTVAGWSKASGPTGCTITGAVGSQTLACARVDLTSGQSYSVHITAATSFADCATYHNTATAHASNAPDATASATITCNAPSLTVTKTADAATVNAGDPIGFTITVANGGPGLAKDVVLSDPLPTGLTVAGWSKASGPAGCSVTGAVGSQTLACARVDLASGQSYSVHITAATSFADCATYHNTATAHASNAPDATDSATHHLSEAVVVRDQDGGRGDGECGRSDRLHDHGRQRWPGFGKRCDLVGSVAGGYDGCRLVAGFRPGRVLGHGCRG